MFKKPFSLEGRISRKEYQISVFAFVVVFITTAMLISAYGLVVMIVNIPLGWFLAAQRSKRLHDLDKAPIDVKFNPFYFIFLLFKEGSPLPNQYGPSPLYTNGLARKATDINDEIESIGKNEG